MNTAPLMTACVFLSLTSCSTLRFYSQALQGQVQMLSRAKPVSEVIAAPTTKPLLKRKLSTVQDILHFAETEMHLPARGQYRRYSDLGRRYAVWVVFAAPEFSVRPRTWKYPLVGRLAYRGFFQESLAEKLAAELRAKGDDVHVSGVEAYSTLGFLRDPLLNTFMGRDDADLAELIFHELTHQRLYLKGDTDFNEAFATAAGQEGARRWLRARGRLKELAQYEKDLRLERAFISLALQTRDELKAAYSQPDATAEIKRQSKEAALARFKRRAISLGQRSGNPHSFDRWFNKPVNNARLATVATYYELLPGFEALLKNNGGDLERFYAEVESMRDLSHDARQQKIMALVPR